MKVLIELTFLILLLVIPKTSFGIEINDAVFPELGASGRALAMGNAFINRVDGASSVFYNPAGLGTVRYPHLHLSNFYFETNKDWLRMTTGGPISDAMSGIGDSFSLDGQRLLLRENRGKIAHSRFGLMPNFTARYISIGYLVSKQTRAAIPAAIGSQFEYIERTDHGPYAALNLSLFGGVIKFGASGIVLNRKEASGEADPDVAFELQDSDYKKGVALIVTSGARITLPVKFLPTMSAVVHNSGAQAFSDGGGGAPDTIKQTIDVGFSITPQIGKAVRLHLEANLKDIGGAYSSIASSRKLLLGGEFDISRTFFLRFGYGDGFGSAGIGVKSQALEFDMTTYAVDTSNEGFRGEEDRRFVLNFSSGF